jgi:hypothetical protein
MDGGKCKQFSNRSATDSVINLIVVSIALAARNLFAFHLAASRPANHLLLYYFIFLFVTTKISAKFLHNFSLAIGQQL